MKSEFNFHTPVLLKSVIEYLQIKPGEVYVDATIGGGGHSLEILKKGGRVFGIDCDVEAVSYSQKRLANFCAKLPVGKFACPLNAFKIVRGNFASLSEILKTHGIVNPAGILIDLGTSLHQLKTKGRGFSFLTDEPLDMRMEAELSVTAADLVAALSENELYELFNKLGEEKYSRAIAHDLVLARRQKPIRNTKELAQIAEKVYRKYRVKSHIHPATKIFQALRIAVNDEINNLKLVLPQALELLAIQGRLVIISFHGLEDKIVKNFYSQAEMNNKLKIITKKPIIADELEKKINPKSRSAKLRVAEKIC